MASDKGSDPPADLSSTSTPNPEEELDHYSELTPEELVLEKKLRRKIDILIMPMVVLVYLM
jgi:hypothetical protein